jgi:hypothetical protein
MHDFTDNLTSRGNKLISNFGLMNGKMIALKNSPQNPFINSDAYIQ